MSSASLLKKNLAFDVCCSILMYMNTKTRTNIYLTDEQIQALKKLKEETGASIAWHVGKAIDAYLEQQKGKDMPDKGRKKQ